MNRTIDTRWLTHASFAPKALPRGWQWWLVGAAGAFLLLLAVAGPGLSSTVGDLAAARREQASLAAEVERLSTQLAVDGATRAELEQHAAELSSQVVELTRQVEFLTARRAAIARPN